MLEYTSKVARILKFILFLDGSYPRSKSECINFLDISDSTFYEYIKLLRNSGFTVKQENGNYWIDVSESENKLLAKLFHFNEEEAWLLSKAIGQLDVSLPVASRLYRKLAKIFDTDQALSAVIKKEKSEIVKKLYQAIRLKKQVLLKNYSSGNSQTIRDRWVEPFAMQQNFSLLWAYDLQKMECRQFKTCRIEDVELSLLEWKHEQQHQLMPVDVFRNTGALNLPIELEMTIRAFNLLIEEYPLAEKYCTTLPNGHYLFNTMLAKFEGAARFVLGLAEEIEVKASPEFLLFLKEKLKIIKNKF